MMSGINEIGVARICVPCALDMEPTFVMRCMGSVARGDCERCGRPTMTQIYFYTLRGHEYDRRGIEMIFEEEEDMNDASRILSDMFNAYKHSSQYKDGAMMEIMARREEFEKHLDKMWAIFRSGLFEQAVEYKKQVRSIKAAGLVVLRNSAGKHKIVFPKEG